METMNDGNRDSARPEPRYVSFDYAAEYFSVCKRTIRRLADEGVVPVVRLRPKLPRVDLEAAEAVLLERGLGRAGKNSAA